MNQKGGWTNSIKSPLRPVSRSPSKKSLSLSLEPVNLLNSSFSRIYTQAANRLWIEPVLTQALTGRRITNQRSQYRRSSIVWQKRSTVLWQSKKWIFSLNPLDGSRFPRRGSLLMLGFRRGCRFNERIGWNYFFQR